jgi:hypothetical protein
MVIQLIGRPRLIVVASRLFVARDRDRLRGYMNNVAPGLRGCRRSLVH